MLHNHNGGPPLYDDDIRMNYVMLDIRAFRDGVRGLNATQIGFYWMFLMSMYEHMERLPDDDRWLATAMGLNIKSWRKNRADLIRLGKIQSDGTHIWNRRAETEIAKYCAKVQAKRDAAAEREARKRREREEGQSATNPRYTGDQYEVNPRSIDDQSPMYRRSIRDQSAINPEKVNEINKTKPEPSSIDKIRLDEIREERKDTTTLATEGVAASEASEVGLSSRRDVVVGIISDALRMPTDNAEQWLSSQVALAGQDIVIEAVRIYKAKIDAGELITTPAKFLSALIHKLKADSVVEKKYGPRVDNRPEWARKQDAANSITQQMIKEAMGNG
jgi:uncharacterized protein YdaU (DUF1376 family)